ncbi:MULTISPECIES: DnaJ domain-containing protein [unclassified Sphingomonas]|uniref:DnaJ domain-containing protein n=1 Tax=unclassified Sphingomonas TaxID=196159 RepID=UPI00226A7A85|nr:MULTISPECIES: DnaJ domain-containing protein [unclassified Sphingomonas]
MTLTTARRWLVREVEAMTKRGHNWRVTNMVLSLNIRFTASGARDQNVSRRDPADPGVAFYFDLDRRPHVLACDRWDTVADNIAAIAAHVDALRGQERWGVADLSQAFAGHLALPSRSLPAARPWWSVLEVSASASIDEIDRAYRSKAKAAHPDAGGGREAWDDLVAAYDQAKKERTQ